LPGRDNYRSTYDLRKKRGKGSPKPDAGKKVWGSRGVARPGELVDHIKVWERCSRDVNRKKEGDGPCAKKRSAVG